MGSSAILRDSAAAPRLAPARFDDLLGFAGDDCLAAFAAFRRSARAFCEGKAPPRPARPASPGLAAIARQALAAEIGDAAAARDFFVERFAPFRVVSEETDGRAFFTGYYEPFVDGSLTPTPRFRAPVLARPRDLERRRPYPDRTEIEARGGEAVAWLEDAVEVYFAQVQGSARVRLPDGREVRLAYDGRNGQPYASIGRLLIEAGEIPEGEMSLRRLKGWLRDHGLAPGEEGRALMRRNRSYVFFKLEADFDPALGPVAGAGVALTPLRSIAVDRSIWAYGTPFFIDAEPPWEGEAPTPFRRLTIAQDTGSAIVGAARADIFFGGGETAGARAGAVRCRGGFVALLPRGDER